MTTRIKDNQIKALIYVALALALIFKSFISLPGLPSTDDRRETPQIIAH